MKFVLSSGACTDEPAVGTKLYTNLGPGDSNNLSVTTVSAAFTTPGTYKVCYRPAFNSNWDEVTPTVQIKASALGWISSNEIVCMTDAEGSGKGQRVVVTRMGVASVEEDVTYEFLADAKPLPAGYTPPPAKTEAQLKAEMAAELALNKEKAKYNWRATPPVFPCMAGCGVPAYPVTGRVTCTTNDRTTKQGDLCETHSDCTSNPCTEDAHYNDAARRPDCMQCVQPPTANTGDAALGLCTGTATEVAASCGKASEVNDGNPWKNTGGVDGNGAACALIADVSRRVALTSSCACAAQLGFTSRATCVTGFRAAPVWGPAVSRLLVDSPRRQHAPARPLDPLPRYPTATRCPVCCAGGAAWSQKTACAVASGDCVFKAAFTPACDHNAATDGTDRCAAGCYNHLAPRSLRARPLF